MDGSPLRCSSVLLKGIHFHTSSSCCAAATTSMSPLTSAKFSCKVNGSYWPDCRRCVHPFIRAHLHEVGGSCLNCGPSMNVPYVRLQALNQLWEPTRSRYSLGNVASLTQTQSTQCQPAATQVCSCAHHSPWPRSIATVPITTGVMVSLWTPCTVAESQNLLRQAGLHTCVEDENTDTEGGPRNEAEQTPVPAAEPSPLPRHVCHAWTHLLAIRFSRFIPVPIY